MKRREFIWNLSLGLAAAWSMASLSWPTAAGASKGPLPFAFLADPHLRDGDETRPEALALARAVAEIRALKPAPRLVFFAGDLAHDGDPGALALGQEILSDLPMPVLAVRGEGDGHPEEGGAAWDLFGNGRFFYTYEGIHLLGLHTYWQNTPEGPGFALGEAQHRWLAKILAWLEPDAPLLVLSHAPLMPLYRPWGQWTRDSGPLLERLSRFENVVCLHGHVHRCDRLAENNLTISFSGDWFFRKPKTENRKPFHLSLPATSWPLPSPVEGTPRKLRPGLGPHGCGWASLCHGGTHSTFRQVLWKA
ncbi:MAG: metallophosphoesterase [Desulfobaccales bacterium]